METSQLDILLKSILGSKILYGQHDKSLNQWTKVPLRIWFKECKSPLLERRSRLLRWVAFDPDFRPARIDGRFKYWHRIGITSYCSILSKGELDSFQKISEMYGLESVMYLNHEFALLDTLLCRSLLSLTRCMLGYLYRD